MLQISTKYIFSNFLRYGLFEKHIFIQRKKIIGGYLDFLPGDIDELAYITTKFAHR